MGLQAASIFGNLLGMMMQGGNQQASLEAQRVAAEQARQARIQQLQERREAVSRWEAEQQTVRSRREARRKAARARFLRETQEAFSDIEELSRLGGAGFDGSAHDLGDLQVVEKVGAFGTKVLVPSGTIPGGGPPSPSEPVPAQLRGTGTLYSKPDAPPTITSEIPPSAEVALQPQGQPVGQGGGVQAGPADVAPPPNPTGGASGLRGAPGGPTSSGGTGGGSWGVRPGEVALGALKEGLVESGKVLARQTAANARRTGKVVIPGSAAGLIGTLGDWGIHLLDAANRHQDRDVAKLERGARDIPDIRSRIAAIRRRLADGSLPAVERSALEREKDRLTRDLVELTRHQEQFRHNDAYTNAFDATFDKRTVVEATTTWALETISPAKKALGMAKDKLVGKSAGLLRNEAFQVASAAHRRAGNALGRGINETLRRAPGVPVKAARRGLEKGVGKALKDPTTGQVEKAIETRSGYADRQKRLRDALGSLSEGSDLAPRR
jgi:hypothetical protein